MTTLRSPSGSKAGIRVRSLMAVSVARARAGRVNAGDREPGRRGGRGQPPGGGAGRGGGAGGGGGGSLRGGSVPRARAGRVNAGDREPVRRVERGHPPERCSVPDGG